MNLQINRFDNLLNDYITYFKSCIEIKNSLN